MSSLIHHEQIKEHANDKHPDFWKHWRPQSWMRDRLLEYVKYFVNDWYKVRMMPLDELQLLAEEIIRQLREKAQENEKKWQAKYGHWIQRKHEIFVDVAKTHGIAMSLTQSGKWCLEHTFEHFDFSHRLDPEDRFNIVEIHAFELKFQMGQTEALKTSEQRYGFDAKVQSDFYERKLKEYRTEWQLIMGVLQETDERLESEMEQQID